MVQTSLCSVCTGDLGQDFPIQTSHSVNKMFIICPKQESNGIKTLKILFTSLRGLKHLAGFLLSLASSPIGTKITLQSPALNFLNEWRQNFSLRINERACGWNNNLWKVTKSATAMQVMPACASIAQRSVLIQPCDLWCKCWSLM